MKHYHNNAPETHSIVLIHVKLITKMHLQATRAVKIKAIARMAFMLMVVGMTLSLCKQKTIQIIQTRAILFIAIAVY